jgi:hypothetical protein
LSTSAKALVWTDAARELRIRFGLLAAAPP